MKRQKSSQSQNWDEYSFHNRVLITHGLPGFGETHAYVIRCHVSQVQRLNDTFLLYVRSGYDQLTQNMTYSTPHHTYQFKGFVACSLFKKILTPKAGGVRVLPGNTYVFVSCNDSAKSERLSLLVVTIHYRKCRNTNANKKLFWYELAFLIKGRWHDCPHQMSSTRRCLLFYYHFTVTFNRN